MDRMRIARQLTLWLCAAALAGCVHVATYERGVLARPDMRASDPGGPAERHVTQVHEGASGGGDLAESGCGCN
jgi:Domain of unknown function (DUF4266)